MCVTMNHEKITLPGVQHNSAIQQIYDKLCDGQNLTTMDCVKGCRTFCLAQYVSILRNKYNVPVMDKWINVGKCNDGARPKKVKIYWINMAG